MYQSFNELMSIQIGEGEDGKLGHNNRITLDKPKLVEALRSKRIRDIACGSSHSAAITASGELYCWGLGEVEIILITFQIYRIFHAIHVD